MRPGLEHKEPEPGALLVSVLAQNEELALAVADRLEAEFGPLDLSSFWISFAHSRYYEAEMGDGLGRYILFFSEPMARELLVEAKLFTDCLEMEYAAGGGRRVNLDPGYLALEHLILASTKAVPHRPYLGRGIYADLTLVYECGQYIPLRWSYPDYSSDYVRALCSDVRAKILKLRKQGTWRV
ncbi:MAG: DUF4416 domain-containing protein [Deltaproteobacteria bacterium]|nr:MAG: DUF4416 domain-containing protein [Deltaproteobacteria bacterium]